MDGRPKSAAQKATDVNRMQTPWMLKAHDYLGNATLKEEEEEEEIDTEATSYKIFIMFEDPNSSFPAMMIGMIISVMIVFSTATFIIETIPRVQETTSETLWFVMETVCIVMFTGDFIIRAVCAPNHSKFWKSGMNWIDIIAIIPYYLEIIIGAINQDLAEALGLSRLRVIRTVRLAKLVQTYSMWKYKEDLSSVIVDIIIQSGPALAVPLYFMFLALVVLASLAYFSEKQEGHMCGTGCDTDTYDVCDEWKDGSIVDQYDAGACCYCYRGQEYSSDYFTDIPTGFWWAFVTMTTVGYGDSYTRSWSGRYVSILTTVTGIFFMAMPLTIVGSTFNLTWDTTQRNVRKKNRKITREDQPQSHKSILRNFYAISDTLANLRAIVSKMEETEDGDLSQLQEGVEDAMKAHDPIAFQIKQTFEIDESNQNETPRVLEGWDESKREDATEDDLTEAVIQVEE